MTQRFWLGTLSGCYVGHGETYKHPQDILWWSKGGVLHGQSPRRIQWLKDFMKTAPPFHELTPMGDEKGRFILGKENEYYLVYCQAGQTESVVLPGNQPYKVDVIDPWEMTQESIGSANSGSYTVTATEQDLVYRFTPHTSGEAIRPEALPSASVTEGVPPLEVTFKSNSKHRVAWDFDDGSHSDQSDPIHTYFKVCYNATSHRDNVAWYFTEPASQSNNNPQPQLDHRTTYNTGAVATKIGPLAIGNFNRTMENYGWDRQFRREIKRIEIFGSHLGGRGAIGNTAFGVNP